MTQRKAIVALCIAIFAKNFSRHILRVIGHTWRRRYPRHYSWRWIMITRLAGDANKIRETTVARRSPVGEQRYWFSNATCKCENSVKKGNPRKIQRRWLAKGSSIKESQVSTLLVSIMRRSRRETWEGGIINARYANRKGKRMKDNTEKFTATNNNFKGGTRGKKTVRAKKLDNIKINDNIKNSLRKITYLVRLCATQLFERSFAVHCIRFTLDMSTLFPLY